MEISYTKDKEFKLAGKNIAVSINPSANTKADAILNSISQGNNKPDTLVFDGPGEYEVKGSMIHGISTSQSDETIYVVSIDDIKIAYLPEVTKLFGDDELDLIGSIDVLLIAINDLKATELSKVVSQIEPRVVIPMNYNSEQLKLFESEVGTVPSPIDKYKISKKDLINDTQQIVVLKG